MSDLARRVRSAMRAAGVKEYRGVVYAQDYYRAAAGNDDKLHLSGSDGDLTSSYTASNDGQHLQGDFSCWVQYPTIEEREAFVEIIEDDFFGSLRERERELEERERELEEREELLIAKESK
jgi:hypothetical protein